MTQTESRRDRERITARPAVIDLPEPVRMESLGGAEISRIQAETFDATEETRLTYRYLDLRRETLHETIMMRARVIASLRARYETLVEVTRTDRPPRVAALSAALALGLGQGTSAFAQLWPA